MAEAKGLLGWGIVGTPKGRQRASAGLDEQINQAGIFDLDQNIGQCLPDPIKDRGESTLYYLTYREISGYTLLGIAEYRSVKEMGQNRTGSYFGSFIECINSNFSTNEADLKILFSDLYNLNLYQYKSFIDTQDMMYSELIDGKKVIELPNLDKISQKLTALRPKFINHVNIKESLFVYTGNISVINIMKFLLEQQVYHQYKHIYFSSSTEITNKIKQRKNVDVIDFTKDLFKSSYFTISYQQEILALHKDIKSLMDKENQLKENNVKLQSLLEQQEKEKEQEINRRVSIVIGEEKEQLHKIQDKIEQEQIFIDLGKKILGELTNHKEALTRYNLVEISNTHSRNQLNSVIKPYIDRLSSEIKEQSKKVESVNKPIEYKESIYTWIFAAISIIFLVIIGILIFIYENKNDKDDRVSPILKNEIIEVKNKIENIDENNKILLKKLGEITSQLEENKDNRDNKGKK
ncbi:hypothetical protein [Volucribacter amazonae]|uniref:Uncharacterized protein n=1 Tax=Volucribacter amazonae TaxID=256731 RepID=A0A9X4SR61_9PAST|nr:hypothetical protein [Volucribacter amazonae]MDG6896231.1 hypothetical protein [Volucribacter amazonae]